jgi:NDP-sugar pyrophosphorylase family protein
MIEFWKHNATARAMIAVTQNIRHDYSQVHFDTHTSLVSGIEEKPKLSYPSWTGIGIFNREYFLKVYENLELNGKNIEGYLDFGYHVLPAMAKDGGLHAYQYDGQWFDVGNLRSYQKLAKEYQNKDLNL